MQEALQSGETLSPEFQDQIAQEITLLTQEIDQIYQGQQQPSIQEQQPNENGITPPTPTTRETQTTPETGQGSIPTGEQVPELENAPHPSSNISRFRYDPESQQLFVQFLGKYPDANGAIYKYHDVPKFIFDVFARGAVAPKTSGRNKWHTWKEGKTPSHGAAMYALIKSGAYPYQRLS